MRNVIKGTHAGKDYVIFAHAISQVIFDEADGKVTSAEVYYVGEEDAVQTITEPFVLEQLVALTETIANSFNVRVGQQVAHLPFSSVSVVFYSPATENLDESAQVILNNGTTIGLDASETEDFRSGYGKWLDRKGI